jgi:hypothetical protein
MLPDFPNIKMSLLRGEPLSRNLNALFNRFRTGLFTIIPGLTLFSFYPRFADVTTPPA